MAVDSSDIDNALVAKLGSDSLLLSYMPDNVYMDEAPQNTTRFVIVSLVDEEDSVMFGGRSHESALYLVKAVGLSNTNPNMKAAAARIDALLEGQTLTAIGYSPMAMHRESRIRVTEVDEMDSTIRWFHRGGHYRVVMST
jgi:hypothetical protein